MISLYFVSEMEWQRNGFRLKRFSVSVEELRIMVSFVICFDLKVLFFP